MQPVQHLQKLFFKKLLKNPLSCFLVILQFLSYCFLSYYLFSNSHAQGQIKFINHIISNMNFGYIMYYIMSETYIDERFLEDCFYCFSQQIISAVANESPIPYNLIKRAPETQNL